jgi:hypothetical protein
VENFAQAAAVFAESGGGVFAGVGGTRLMLSNLAHNLVHSALFFLLTSCTKFV